VYWEVSECSEQSNAGSSTKAVEGNLNRFVAKRFFLPFLHENGEERQQKVKLTYTKRWSSGKDVTCHLNVGQDCPRKRVKTYGSMACTMPPRPSLGGPM
jgi:hypothetical protein